MVISNAIIMAQVSTDASPLGHPVQPNASARVMDVVVLDQRVDGGVQFDARHLSSAEGFVAMDVVDMVSGDLTERAAHAAADAGRSAVVDRIVSYNVGTYRLF